MCLDPVRRNIGARSRTHLITVGRMETRKGTCFCSKSLKIWAQIAHGFNKKKDKKKRKTEDIFASWVFDNWAKLC